MAAEELEALSDRGWLYHPSFPEHWTRCSLHSMARWVNGIAFRDIQFSPSGKAVIKIAEIKGGSAVRRSSPNRHSTSLFG
jgi:type I restriction enzyme S subunit